MFVTFLAMTIGLAMGILLLGVAGYLGRDRLEEALSRLASPKDRRSKTWLGTLWGEMPSRELSVMGVAGTAILFSSSLAFLQDFLTALVVGLCGYLLAPRVYLLWRKRRLRRKLPLQIRPTLRIIVTAIRGGATVSKALDYAARHVGEPMAGELGQVIQEVHGNIPLPRALGNMAERIGSREIRAFTDSLALTADIGAEAAVNTLEGADSLVRERLLLKKKLAAHTSSIRLAFSIASTTPLLFGMGFALVVPEYRAILETREGNVLMVVAVLFLALGWYVTIRMLHKAQDEI